MMQENGRFGTSQKTREFELTAGGRQQVLAANYQVHFMTYIIGRNGEMIGPVARTISQ